MRFFLLASIAACGLTLSPGPRLPARSATQLMTRAGTVCAQLPNPFNAKTGGTALQEKPTAKKAVKKVDEKDGEEEGWTLDKVAKLGLAGVLSIAVAESVFWVLSFPISSIFYYFATGEWIDLFTQEGQVKFLAFTAGWGALGGAIAQYRTVLTAAAITPWMDENVVQPYIAPLLNKDKEN